MQRETRCTLAKKGASGGKSQEAAGNRKEAAGNPLHAGKAKKVLLEGDGAGIIGAGGEGGSIG